MLHTSEYYIFVECIKVLASGKMQGAWCASWAIFVGVSWGCVQGSVSNHAKVQLPPDMSKICQSMSF